MQIGQVVYVNVKGHKCCSEIVSREFPYWIVQLYGSGLEISFYEDEMELV